MSKFEPSVLNEMIDFWVESHKNEPDYDPSIKDAAELELDVLQGKCDPNGKKLNKEKFNVELEPYKGNLSFNLLDYIRNLDPDTKDELMYDGDFWPFVADGLIKEIKTQYSRRSYNSQILEIRQAILQSDAFPEMFMKFIQAFVEDTKWSLAVAEQYRNCYYGLYHSHFLDENQELRDYISGYLEPSVEHPRTNEKDVDEMVDVVMDKFGITEYVAECLRIEAEVLAEKDPEASARAIEREKSYRNRY